MIQNLSVFVHHPLGGRRERRRQEAEDLEDWKTGSLEHLLRASGFPLISGADKQ